jgi:chromate reductase, NAD(P)H dehydrogenase (quinone)
MANVLAICGSLRKGSFNRMLMNASIGLAPEGMTIKEAPSFANFPIYNFDIQQSSGFPADVDALNNAVTAADGVLIVSAAPGLLGGSRMQYHLRQSLAGVDAILFGKPEVIVNMAAAKFADGQLKDQGAIDLIKQQLAAFGKFIERVKVR